MFITPIKSNPESKSCPNAPRKMIRSTNNAYITPVKAPRNNIVPGAPTKNRVKVTTDNIARIILF